MYKRAHSISTAIPSLIVDIILTSTPTDVVLFLATVHLDTVTALFTELGINGERFLALTMEDLVDMGVDNAYARKQILNEVVKQKGLYFVTLQRCVQIGSC